MTRLPRSILVNVMVRTVVGGALAGGSSRIASAVEGRRAGRVPVVLTALLGIRHLAEAVVLAVKPGHLQRRSILATDVVHASSMVGLVALRRDQRRLAGAAAIAGFAFVLLDAVTLDTGRPRPGVRPTHD